MACGESMADSIHMNGLQGPTPMVVDNDEITPEMRSSAEDEKDKGNQCYKEKDYNKAISHYSKAIDLCPDDARYYTNRSAAKMMILKYKDALNDAQLAIKLDTAFAKAYLREAKCHIALGNAQAALLSLQKAKEIDPSTHHAVMTEVQHANSLTNYEQQSEQAFKSKDYRQVEYYMRRATAIAPACVGYKIQQAESLALMGKYKEAQDIALDVLRSDRMNADAVYIRALCMYYDDDIDKAVNFFTHALKLSPDHSGARSTLKKAKQLARKKSEGNDAFKSNRTQQAYDLYSEALAIDENNRKTNAKLFCNRALVGGKLGKWEEAASDCTKAIDLDSDYVKAYQRRAKCYSRLEKYDEAVYDYKKAYDLDRTRENKRALQEAEAELKRSKRKDYYKILGVEKNATDDQIKKAYRKQALVYHPDRHAHATDSEKETAEHKFKEVGEAYSVLTDENKRARYDRGEDLDGPSGLQDIDPNNIFQMFFGGGGGPGMQFSQGGHGHGNAGGGFPGGFHFQFG